MLNCDKGRRPQTKLGFWTKSAIDTHPPKVDSSYQHINVWDPYYNFQLNSHYHFCQIWVKNHFTRRGRSCRWSSSWIGGMVSMHVRRGFSSAQTHPRIMAISARRQNLVQSTLPRYTNGNGAPHGCKADLWCVGDAMKPKDSHGTPPNSSPKGDNLSTKDRALSSPISEPRSWKTLSLRWSKPCLNSAAMLKGMT
jgi:hypothetical protein